MNWFLCIFLTLILVDLISSNPTHWFPLQAYGTFCWSSHFTVHLFRFTQICTNKKSYHVIFNLEKSFLAKNFTWERILWKSLQIHKMQRFPDFLKCIFISVSYIYIYLFIYLKSQLCDCSLWIFLRDRFLKMSYFEKVLNLMIICLLLLPCFN
jgi:hypothetical protein